MQKEAPAPEPLVRRPVAGVPHHGMADRRHVHADLVRAPALECELEQGRRILPRSPFQDRVPGACRLPRVGHRHFGRRAGGTADRGLHLAAVVGHGSGHQGEVTALHRPGRQLIDERPVGLLGPGHGEEARRALVEPVHDPRPVRWAHSGRHQVGQVRETGQQPADEGSLVVAGAGVHDQPRRLVHHGHRVVGVDDVEAHAGLGSDPGVVSRREHDREGGPLAEHLPAHRDRGTVDPYAARCDQLRRGAPGHVGHHGDAAIHPDPCEQGRDLRRDGLLATSRWSRVGMPAHAAFPTLGSTGARAPKSRATMMMITPMVTQASARLKVGQ